MRGKHNSKRAPSEADVDQFDKRFVTRRAISSSLIAAYGVGFLWRKARFYVASSKCPTTLCAPPPDALPYRSYFYRPYFCRASQRTGERFLLFRVVPTCQEKKVRAPTKAGLPTQVRIAHSLLTFMGLGTAVLELSTAPSLTTAGGTINARRKVANSLRVHRVNRGAAMRQHPNLLTSLRYRRRWRRRRVDSRPEPDSKKDSYYGKEHEEDGYQQASS